MPLFTSTTAATAATAGSVTRRRQRDEKDQEALAHVRQIVSLDCYSLRQIADSLNNAGVRTVNGKLWRLEQVRLLYQRRPW